MAARGAFLAPVLVPVASSFVNLPHAFVQSFLGGPDVVRSRFNDDILRNERATCSSTRWLSLLLD